MSAAESAQIQQNIPFIQSINTAVLDIYGRLCVAHSNTLLINSEQPTGGFLSALWEFAKRTGDWYVSDSTKALISTGIGLFSSVIAYFISEETLENVGAAYGKKINKLTYYYDGNGNKVYRNTADQGRRAMSRNNLQRGLMTFVGCPAIFIGGSLLVRTILDRYY